MVGKTSAELVAEAQARTEQLGPDDVAREMAEGALVVDIREPEERAGGVIPGSIGVPRGMLEFRADTTSSYHMEGLDPDARVILHCAAGGRSALASDTLKAMGYTNVAHLTGGMNAWKDAGKAIDVP